MRVLKLAPLILILAGCQLGRPYSPPYVETPFHWKNLDDSQQSQQGPYCPSHWKNDEPQSANQGPYRLPEQSEDQTEDCSQEDDQSIGRCAPTENIAVCQSVWCSPYPDDIENWWEIFEDPILNKLEQQAIRSNYSLWAAVERMNQAYALARVYGSERWPQITFDPSYTRSGMLIQNPLAGATSGLGGLGGGAGATSTSDLPLAQQIQLLQQQQQVQNSIPALVRIVNSALTLPFNFNWDVDPWSRLLNTYIAAELQAEAATEAYLGVLLNLTTDIATNYFELRGLDSEQEVLQRTIAARQTALEINTARFQAGLAVYTDASRAQEQLYVARADSIDVARRRSLQENVLALLSGIPASVFCLESNPLKGPPPGIPTGIPADVLYRRPDVAEAERVLASAHAQIRVAEANFYPSLRLSATLGLESPDLSHLFTWQARLWAIAANVTQPIFTAGRNSANLAYNIANYREALNLYFQQVMIAYREVEDALINIKLQARQEVQLDLATNASYETLTLSQIRYRQGLVNYLEVVDAEREYLQNQTNSVRVLALRYQNSALLVRAIGGGWEPIAINIKREDEDKENCAEKNEN